MTHLYADVIFPLALPQAYTYRVPNHLHGDVAVGKRVEVPLKSKLYAGIITNLHDGEGKKISVRVLDIVSVLDKISIVSEKQIQFWQWMATYYCCTLGEVMNAALPTSLKLESETKVIAHPDFDTIDTSLSDDEYMVAEAISIQNELTLLQIQDILDRKTIFPIIRSLLDKGIVSIKEELIMRYKPKLINVLHLCEPFASNPQDMAAAFELVARYEKQSRALLAFMQLTRGVEPSIPMSEVMTLADVEATSIKPLITKGILRQTKEHQSRANTTTPTVAELPPLNSNQQSALELIREHLAAKLPVLLHGVTGSGKTRVYSELIVETIKAGRQVLFLLPEIALTSHLVDRLRANIPAAILVTHSRMNNHERVDIWNAVNSGAPVIVAARSGLFLPFRSLGLVIIDEEHDPSYKQQDPSPRYNARDAALVLARQHDATVILGSATPSLESYYNAFQQKYGIVSLNERHGESVLPLIELVDLKKAHKDKRFDGLLSSELHEAITLALEKGEQIILFQNRRGYAPTLGCTICGWHAECPNCDVHQTVHKGINQLKCHYCGYKQKKPQRCPQCASIELAEQGLGTEKIEEHITTCFPTARIGRLDMDTAKTKYAFDKVIHEFENKEIDILVGTQMIAKGLDFDNISLVGVINADGLLRYPDFRASERAFQLLTQVAGRAGRRATQGKVIIQSYSPEHPVLYETLHHLYGSFYQREVAERKAFMYPPVYKLIEIEFTHKNAETAAHAAQVFADFLKTTLGARVVGPAEPTISRLRGMYIQHILIKHEKDPSITRRIKKLIDDGRLKLREIPATKSVRIVVDVDPY